MKVKYKNWLFLLALLLISSNYSAYAGQKTFWQKFGKEYVKIKYDPSHTKQCGNNFTGTIVSFSGGRGTYVNVPTKTKNGEIVTSIRTGRLCYRYYQVSFHTWNPSNMDAGGYFSNHRNSPRKAAVFVTQILSFIKNSGLNRGKKLIYIGSSAGALVGASALDFKAHYRGKTFESLVDRAIFVSGPLMGNLNNGCDHIKGATQKLLDSMSRSKKCTENSTRNSLFNRYENVVDTQKTFWSRGYLRYKKTNINIILGNSDVGITRCVATDVRSSKKTCRWPNMRYGVQDYLYHIFYPTRSASNSTCARLPDEGLYDRDNGKYATCTSIPGTHALWETYTQPKLHNNISKLVCKYAAIEGDLSRASRKTCNV